ncbi:MAG: hypothetical protein JWM04_1542 [Verrucomicrobiales bacterium]|nr:hypothetical protein [Verrucomicrobiales bacterium]
MIHPKPEEWIPYLYQECTPETSALLKSHLAECSECAARLEKWKAVGKELQTWKAPSTRTGRAEFPAMWKWAAAAVILLTIGFGLGNRNSRQDLNVAVQKALRDQTASLGAAVPAAHLTNLVSSLVAAEMAKLVPLQQTRGTEHDRMIISEFAGLLQRTREEDQKAVFAMISEVSTKNSSDYVALRKDLETLASATDDEIRFSRQKLLQLSYNGK